MRRLPPEPRRASFVRLLSGMFVAAALAFTTLSAQIPGRNVNMVSGLNLPNGDPYLQRQNEPSIAASTRNPLHLLGGSNDYRTVDVPGLPDGAETGDAWLGLFKSVDGGQRWSSGLLPGYPQDQSPAGLGSPLKGYQAGADAVVRAGTNGLLYYSGLVFDRGEDGKSGIFLARFIDNNNQEAGDPIGYLGTSMVAKSTGAAFLDKPWMAVDIPRSGSGYCTVTADSIIPTSPRGALNRRNNGRRNGWWNPTGRPKPTASGTQRLPAGAVYVAYSSITGEGANLRSEILLKRSTDCGATWSAPIRVSRTQDQINQGASLTIDPRTGTVYVGWRRFDPDLTDANDLDGVMVARLPYGSIKMEVAYNAHRFPKPKSKLARKLHKLFEHREERFKDNRTKDVAEEMDQFDLGTTGYNFRTNAYPTMTADGDGRIYMAWTQRGFAADSGLGDGARVVVTTTRDGRTFTAPRPVENTGKGHQLMPSMVFAGGKLMVLFYDLRDTKAELSNGSTAVHDRLVSDANKVTRHTIDIRSAMASPGDSPVFGPSVRVSDYLMGFNPASGEIEELQVNPPNLPMFKQGTVPFIGDYIDVAAAPTFVPVGKGRWAYNTAAGQPPVFHAAWTDNRDVRPPADGNWANYTPAPARMTPEQLAGISQSDPMQAVLQCTDGSGNPGSRNQNVYSARITGGLLAGSPGNTKPLSTDLQRGFVVFAQNTSAETKSFRMTILNQPPGGRASFEQFPTPQNPGPDTAVEMIVPPRSTASRTVYVTSSDPKAGIDIDVSELLYDPLDPAIPTPQTAEKPGGLEARVLLNPDIENPDIENPDIENPDIDNPDIENVEVYNPDIENPDIENPDIENPDIENPDIENPDIENPDIENPDIENVRVANPDIENVGVATPDIENPDIENPDIENPDIENPDIENGTISDITWKVTNAGNTTASFNVNVFLAQQNLPAGVHTQLILLKTYRTPVTAKNSCQLGFQTRNILLANIPNPVFIQPGSGGVPDQNDPAETNATLWLAPGEEGRIVLRAIDDDRSNNINVVKTYPDGSTRTVSVDPAFAPTTSSTPAVASQGVGSEDAAGGQTDPPLVTPTGANLFFIQMPVNGIEGRSLTPAVSVQVRDNLTGTPVAGSTVTMTFGNNPGAASLAGAVAVSDINGIATFPALAVSSRGSSYTLVATANAAGVMAAATSTPFDIAPAIPPTVVVNTSNSGYGSLRGAIEYANATEGVQTITFAIPGQDVTDREIVLQTPLPAITDSVIIDATTQPGWTGRPVVAVSGALLPADSNGFVITASAPASVIRGLIINQFATSNYTGGSAIVLAGANNIVEGNFIGTSLTAGPPAIMNYTGVLVTNWSTGNRIGGSNAGMRNVIAGNAQGVWIQGASSTVVAGNNIGIDPTGSHVIPVIAGGAVSFGNQYGVLIDAGAGNVIGAAGGGLANIISGNGTGVQLRGGAATQILGNNVGVDVTGTTAVPNGDGISAYGLVTGTTIGGFLNVIAGNVAWGISLENVGESAPTDTTISHAHIGLGIDGQAQPNGAGGVRVVSAPGTRIGQNGSATVISGNGGPGVVVSGSDVEPKPIVEWSYVGTNPNGQEARPNVYEGVALFAPAMIRNNLISGNGNAAIAAGTGIQISEGAEGSEVLGNTIGPNALGAPLGNGYSGITVWGGVDGGVVIGGDAPGEANTISGNPASGIAIYTVGEGARPEGIRIAGNRIFANGGLGIDLDADGHTPNDISENGRDLDAGANQRQNYPVVLAARNDLGATTRLEFSGSTLANGIFDLRFFANSRCDSSDYGEGERPIARMTYDPTNGPNGVLFASELVPAGQFITATATDGSGNTSEFSECAVVTNPAPPAQLPPMSVHVVSGQAGGGANTNLSPAGGIDPVAAGFVNDGQQVTLAATGNVWWYSDHSNLATPDGAPIGTDAEFLAPGLPAISLVARIGNGPWRFIGTGPTTIGGAGQSGTLQLAVNDSSYGDLLWTPVDDSNGGAFTVTVTKVTAWGAHAYAFIPTHTTAAAAEASCVQAGGHLASVHSASENDFISGLVGATPGFPTAHLGGYLDGTWKWTDGTAWSYTNWRVGEPSGDGNRLQLWPTGSAFAGWNDIPNGILEDGGYLCKIPYDPGM